MRPEERLPPTPHPAPPIPMEKAMQAPAWAPGDAVPAVTPSPGAPGAEGRENAAAGLPRGAAGKGDAADETGGEAGETDEDALMASLSARACTKLCDP
jgi:hypothetical protein